MIKKPTTSNAVFIRQKGHFRRLPLAAIQYIEARKNYTMVVTREEKLMVLTSLKRWENVLPTDRFCRIHRAYIVALDAVQRFDSRSACVADSMLPIGESYSPLLMQSIVVVDGLKGTSERSEGRPAVRPALS